MYIPSLIGGLFLSYPLSEESTCDKDGYSTLLFIKGRFYTNVPQDCFSLFIILKGFDITKKAWLKNYIRGPTFSLQRS